MNGDSCESILAYLQYTIGSDNSTNATPSMVYDSRYL